MLLKVWSKTYQFGALNTSHRYIDRSTQHLRALIYELKT